MADKKEDSGRRVLYTATMHHDAKSVKRMAHMQYRNFIYKRRRIFLAVALALLGAGAYIVTVREGWGVFTLALGALALWLLDLVPRRVTKQAIKNFAGKYPSIHAFVTDSGVSTQLVTDEVAFEKLLKLVEDKKYVYIYISEITAFMLEKSSVDGDGGVDAFKAYLSEKTGLKWEKPIIL